MAIGWNTKSGGTRVGIRQALFVVALGGLLVGCGGGGTDGASSPKSTTSASPTTSSTTTTSTTTSTSTTIPPTTTTAPPPTTEPVEDGPPETYTLHGDVVVPTEQVGQSEIGDQCFGGPAWQGEWPDIDTGTQVVVYDGSGNTLAVGAITTGTVGTRPLPGGYEKKACLWAFTVEGIPSSDFYAIQVANRNKLTYPASQLDEWGWSMRITLD